MSVSAQSSSLGGWSTLPQCAIFGASAEEAGVAASEMVGSIAALWRFPVKSMLGEQLQEAELTEHGLVGDRAYALIDSETGKVVSAKSVRQFPNVLACRAAFVQPPAAGNGAPPVRVSLPDGSSVTSDDAGRDFAFSQFFGRDVRLATAAPEDFTIDQYHPDLPDIDPAGHRDTLVEQKLGSAFFGEAGLPSPVPVGAFFDLFPVSVLTTSTLARLNAVRPESRFDARRFRMNVIVETEQEGFPENEWIGRSLELGDRARIRLEMSDPRCVMPTLAQEDLPKDSEILRTLTQHNRLQIGDSGRYPCAGVYAVVETTGTLRTGDPVVLH
jgi:uncharacterized protein